MSFREKSAWVTLTALLIALALYVFHVPSLIEAPGHGLLLATAVSVAAFIVIEVVAYIVIRARHPRDARTPKDERERLIETRASRVAYYVYAVGSLVALAVTLHVVRTNAAGVGTAVLLAFVLAEIMKYSTRIILYRRDV